MTYQDLPIKVIHLSTNMGDKLSFPDTTDCHIIDTSNWRMNLFKNYSKETIETRAIFLNFNFLNTNF